MIVFFYVLLQFFTKPWKWTVTLGAHRALCEKFTTTCSQFLGCMIDMGIHTTLLQCTITVVHNCSTTPLPLLVCTLANGHPELGFW